MVWSVVNGEVNGEPVDLTTFNVSAGELVTSPEEFIFEWEKLLRMIARDLLTAGYTPSLENFSYLEKLLGR